MLFNSLTFVAFFAAVVLVYWAVPCFGLRKTWLLAASYLFYGAWNPPFVLLLALSTVVDFFAGRRLAAAASPGSRRGWLATSLVANLGLLGYFKYGNFLMDNFVTLLGLVGVRYAPPHMDIVLPVGISFYTFQTLSYTLDIYRRRMEPTRSLRDFALYVSFFPQLVAGPIVRAADFLPQLLAAPKLQSRNLCWGIFLLTLGLFEKTVLADTLLSGPAEQVFSHPAPLAMLDAWAGVFAFSGQIFFDFAGYSTCAIGAALCLGFTLPDNFRFPYAAVGLSDFWRRWHISLSTWLRDYLYIPLGGNRKGPARAAWNLLLVMFLGGLWHGAAWTFVAWGLLHGLYLVVEHFMRGAAPDKVWSRSWPARIGLILLTYFLVCIAWVLFRAPDFAGALRMYHSMACGWRGSGWDTILTSLDLAVIAAVTSGTLMAHTLMRDRSLPWLAEKTPSWLLAIAWAVLGFLVIINQGSGNAFIYFQF